MKTKTIIVTGSTIGGIGYETAVKLAGMGHKLIVTSRSLKRAEKAAHKIGAQAFTLDLTDSGSINRFVKDLGESVSSIDILINNAGYLTSGRRLTDDGREMTAAVNFEGTKELTEKLLPLVSRGGRIINVTSTVASMGRIDRLGKSWGFKAYCDSKLAINLYTRELSERLEESDITVNAVHPGVIVTNIWRKIWPHLEWLEFLINGIDRMGIMSADKGARTLIFLAVSDTVEGETDGYYSNCRKFPWPQNCQPPQLSLKKEI